MLTAALSDGGETRPWLPMVGMGFGFDDGAFGTVFSLPEAPSCYRLGGGTRGRVSPEEGVAREVLLS